MASGDIQTDSDGVESIARPFISKGFVTMSGAALYDVTDAITTTPLKYAKIQRFMAVCTDPAGSIGGNWGLLVSPTLLIPQPKVAADLKAGDVIVLDFVTPLAESAYAPLQVQVTNNLGTWQVAVFGYYTAVPTVLY